MSVALSAPDDRMTVLTVIGDVGIIATTVPGAVTESEHALGVASHASASKAPGIVQVLESGPWPRAQNLPNINGTNAQQLAGHGRLPRT